MAENESIIGTEKKGFRLPSMWTIVITTVLVLGGYYSFIRFTQGLGPVSDMNNNVPWGMWIGFDVLCGVGLAAGGFTITAMVYIFNVERFHHITRPTVLTAYLGYLLVSVALIYDIGRPYAIWHPLFMWNPHSVMFEVSLCVTIYTSVLTCEFLPIIFERFGLTRPANFLRRFIIPLVLMGVLLSTLHQSSLGTVFLIAPYKVYPLWYTPLLPVFFFVSAMTVGLAMTVFESFLSYRFFRKQLDTEVLDTLVRICGLLLVLYLTLKLIDLKNRNVFYLLLDLKSMEARMFLLEIIVGAVLPIGLIMKHSIRRRRRGLFLISLLVILGFVLNRLNVSVTSLAASNGGQYFPTFPEFMISAFLVAIGFVAFGLAVKHLSIFPEEEPFKQDYDDKVKAGMSLPLVKKKPAL